MALSSTESAGSSLGVLKGSRDAEARALLHGGACQVLVTEGDAARVDGVVAGDEIEQRGLAAAVRADQAVDLAGLDVERHVVNGDDTAEPAGDGVSAQRGHGRDHSPVGRMARRSVSRSGLDAGLGVFAAAEALGRACGSVRSTPPGIASTTVSRTTP